MKTSVDVINEFVEVTGLILDQEKLKEQWDVINIEQGSLINNDSEWSSFWRLISEMITKPTLDLNQSLIAWLIPALFVKTASNSALDLHAESIGMVRKPASKAKGWINFYITSGLSEDIIIPAGTRINSELIDGKIYTLQVPEDKLISRLSGSSRILCEALEVGSSYNLASNYYINLVDSIAGIESVANGIDWLVELGSEAESDEALQLRYKNKFLSIGQYHTDATYRTLISEFSGIDPQYIFFDHSAPRGAGTANCYVMIESGVPPQSVIDGINRHLLLESYHGLGDDLLVLPVLEKPVFISAYVYFSDAISTKEDAILATQKIEQLIRCVFRENNDYVVQKILPFSLLSFSYIGKLIHDYIADVEGIRFFNNDINLQMELGVINNIEINHGFSV